MISLHLLRHADAGDPGAWAGDDASRPLSDKGARQAERLGRHLATIDFEPDAIVTSPKRRARETAELVAAALGGPDVRVDDGLGGAFGPGDLAGLLRDAGSPRRPVLVGHDPDFSDLLSTLVGARLSMRKGALARVDLEREPAPGAGQLRWLLPPDLLPR